MKYIRLSFRLIKEYELVIFNGLNVFFSLLQTVLITKFLNQEDYGKYGFYLSLSQYIYVVCNWGFLTWGVNKISADSKRTNVYFSSITRARILTGSCAYILLTFYLFITYSHLSSIILIAFLIYSLSIIFSPEILYISSGRIKTLVIINVFMKFLYLIIIYIFLMLYTLQSDKIFLLFSFLMFSTTIMLLYKSELNYEKKSFYENSSLLALKSGAPNFYIVIVSFLFASGPVIFSGTFLNAENFAVIYASTAMIKMIQAAYLPLIQRILPKLNSEPITFANLVYIIKKDIQLALVFSLVCIALLWICSPIIVKIVFSSTYDGLTLAIRLFSISLLPGLISTILITQVSIYLNIIKSAYCATAAISLVIFFILIYNINHLSWVLVLSLMVSGEFILLLVMSLIINREIQYRNI